MGVRVTFCVSLNELTPTENEYAESLIGKLADEVLNQELVTILTEAKALIEEWRNEFNQVRLNSSLNQRLSAPEAIIPLTRFLRNGCGNQAT